MDEPTPEVIVHALNIAKEQIRQHREFTLANAIANATMTKNCAGGFLGHQVYRDVRNVIAQSEGLDAKKAAEFTEQAKEQRALDALDKAIKELS